MAKRKKYQQAGSVEVEAVFILPIAILCVFLLLYLSLLLFQRANLQACLETSLVYYKNSVTDTYVTRNSEVSYSVAEDLKMGKGNSYAVTGPLNPYTEMVEALLVSDSDTEDFKKYFQSVAGKQLFDNDPVFTIKYRNYVLVKQYEVTAVQTIELPIDFSLIGADNSYQISATARAVVSDHDDMIRTIDYVIDLTEDTAVGNFFSNIGDKISSGYQKLKEKLGV